MHGILDGISSLHSWMKNQASSASKPLQRGGNRAPRERLMEYDEV